MASIGLTGLGGAVASTMLCGGLVFVGGCCDECDKNVSEVPVEETPITISTPTTTTTVERAPDYRPVPASLEQTTPRRHWTQADIENIRARLRRLERDKILYPEHSAQYDAEISQIGDELEGAVASLNADLNSRENPIPTSANTVPAPADVDNTSNIQVRDFSNMPLAPGANIEPLPPIVPPRREAVPGPALNGAAPQTPRVSAPTPPAEKPAEVPAPNQNLDVNEPPQFEPQPLPEDSTGGIPDAEPEPEPQSEPQSLPQPEQDQGRPAI
ncbi:MAG TPA: hypothetical protein VGP72_12295 [Planctomycetota bacterium]|jgi:hypothetical protein